MDDSENVAAKKMAAINALVALHMATCHDESCRLTHPTGVAPRPRVDFRVRSCADAAVQGVPEITVTFELHREPSESVA